MPRLTIEGRGTFEVPHGKRLVNAIEDTGADQMHACGGHARCTTCRVEFIGGEPQQMTEAEKAVLQNRGLWRPGLRLSCQIPCDRDMEIRLISTVTTSGRPNAGPRPADEVTPEPQWTTRQAPGPATAP